MNFSPKRQQRQLCQLEVLHSEGDSNDGNAKNQTGSQVQQTQFPTEKNNPQDVSDKASNTEAAYFHIPAEGSEYQPANFKALNAERNSNDGQAGQ